MQIPPEELRKYFDYAFQVAITLKAIEIDPEQTLWHYTDGQGLLGILNSHTLYSTQVSCLNDASEIRYASSIFRQALSRLVEAGDKNTKFLAEALDYFNDDPTDPNHIALPYFVACFSKVRDDLSQWRAYGSGENGYAIGFKAKSLHSTPYSYPAQVTYYDPKQHQTIVDEVAAQTLSFFEAGFKMYGSDRPAEWTKTFLENWDLAITQVAPLIKHSAFALENEVRVVRTCYAEDVKTLVFHQKSSMLTRHLPLQLGKPSDAAYRLPVSEVIIGPCRHPHVSRMSVVMLLQQKGYDAKVSVSAIPFQMT